MVTTQQVRRTITASDISRTRSTKLDQNKKYNRREGWPDLHWNPTTTSALPLRNNNPLSAYYTMVEVKEAGLMGVSRRIGPDFRWKSHCRDRTPTNKPWYSTLELQIIHKTTTYREFLGVPRTFSHRGFSFPRPIIPTSHGVLRHHHQNTG